MQPFGWLRTPEGRLRLLRRYNLLLRTNLTEPQLRLVHEVMERWSAARRRGAQRSSAAKGRDRLNRAVPGWRRVLRRLVAKRGGGHGSTDGEEATGAAEKEAQPGTEDT